MVSAGAADRGQYWNHLWCRSHKPSLTAFKRRCGATDASPVPRHPHSRPPLPITREWAGRNTYRTRIGGRGAGCAGPVEQNSCAATQHSRGGPLRNGSQHGGRGPRV